MILIRVTQWMRLKQLFWVDTMVKNFTIFKVGHKNRGKLCLQTNNSFNS